MNTTHTFRSVAIKALTIVGFAATIVLLVWITAQVVKRLPATFASLASLAESMREYRPLGELSLTSPKEVVNSNETFTLSWTDMRKDGEYRLTYACVDGIMLHVKNAKGENVSVDCTESLTDLPKTEELTVSISSEKERFTDVLLTLKFSTPTENTESTLKVTVVNAEVKVKEEAPIVIKEVPVPTPTVSVPKVVDAETKALTPVPASSNIYGFVDLSVKTLGVGVVRNGVFTYTSNYDTNLHNVIKFEVKNIGTKTSGTWNFKTRLPDGDIYESDMQAPLKPMERVEFTLGFNLDEDDDNKFVRIENAVYTENDINSNNDNSVWHVKVQD